MSGASPLAVEVVDDKLVISIGVETLARALRDDPYDADEQGPKLTVHDPLAFAKALTKRLADEINEAGDTLVTEIFEKACGEVVEMADPSCSWREGA